MKAVSSSNRAERPSIWSRVRGVSHSLFTGNEAGKTATEPGSNRLPSGELLLDNREIDFGYVAAVEDIEELLFQTELLANGNDLLLPPSSGNVECGSRKGRRRKGR
jgi:hypothetical protein